MAIEPRQAWHLAIAALPGLEQQYSKQIHQALERAVPYFIKHVQPPEDQMQYRQLMEVLERWHEEGVMDDPPQQSPPPGWLLLQAAIMESEEDWIDWMVRDEQAVHQLACSDIMSSTMQFTRDQNLPLYPDVMKALWDASLSFSVAGDQGQAKRQLLRTSQWFHAAKLDEHDLDEHAHAFLTRLGQAAGYPEQGLSDVSHQRTEMLGLLTLLRRESLLDRAKQITPRTSLRRYL